MKHNEAVQAYKSKNYEIAMKLFKEEVEVKNDQAMTNIGLMYLKGEGVDKDFVKAREWFLKASEYDNDSANYNLALMYQAKLGVEENNDKTLTYLRKAVQKQHQGANFRLALLLLRDRGDKELVKEGFECMLNAAKLKHPMALSQMGGVNDAPDSSASLNDTFRDLTQEKQLEIIIDALDRYIRPILLRDSGDIVLVDYLNAPHIEIRLAYQGNCSGCSMASTSTYGLIRETLTKVIDENIRVYVI